MELKLTDCPACHGSLDAQAVCARCGADLTYLNQLTVVMQRLEAAATHALAEGRFDEARDLLDQAAAYERTPYNQALAAWIPTLAAEAEAEKASETEPETESEKPSRLEAVKQFFTRFRRGEN